MRTKTDKAAKSPAFMNSPCLLKANTKSGNRIHERSCKPEKLVSALFSSLFQLSSHHCRTIAGTKLAGRADRLFSRKTAEMNLRNSRHLKRVTFVNNSKLCPAAVSKFSPAASD